jgi:hypothetical protein
LPSGLAWRCIAAGLRLTVNKASSLALLVCALAAAWALPSVLWNPVPERAQQPSSGAISPAVVAASAPRPAESVERPDHSQTVAQETTTVLLPSRGMREDVKASSQPYKDGESSRLVRDLQRELKRVGCYAHEIDGVWTPATRKAMQDFADRVNAALPVVRPDLPQLILLQSHPETVCRDACRVGGSADTRCLVSSAVAGESTKPAAAAAGPLLVWTKSYVTPASPEPDPAETDPLVEVMPRPESTPRPRRHTGRPSGGGSLFFGILGW